MKQQAQIGNQRKNFTILEIVLCLTLLASFISMVAMLGVRLLKSHVEEEEVRRLENRIKMVELLSPVLDSTGDFYMRNSKNGLETSVVFHFASSSPMLAKEIYPHLSIQDEEICVPFSTDGFNKGGQITVQGSKSYFISF